jgi:hypothetical protein
MNLGFQKGGTNADGTSVYVVSVSMTEMECHHVANAFRLLSKIEVQNAFLLAMMNNKEGAFEDAEDYTKTLTPLLDLGFSFETRWTDQF